MRVNHRFEGTAEKLRFSVPRRLRLREDPQAERYAFELKKLAELRDAGVLSIEEFQQQKTRLLSA